MASHPITVKLICNNCQLHDSKSNKQKAAQKLSKATRQLKQNVLVHSAGRIAKHMQKVAKMARYNRVVFIGIVVTVIIIC